MSDGAPATTVLVVDDSESNRYVLSSWLRRAGHAVIEAATAAEAYAALAARAVDLVILDVQLPDASGLDVCEHIKSDPATEAVPVLHVSATAVAVGDRAAGLQRGADGYLVEPVEREELLAFVQALLRYYGARRRAEDLAGRMARLNRATLSLNAAADTRGLLRAAATGAAATFEAEVVVVLHERGGCALAVPGGFGGEVVRLPEPSLQALAGAMVTGGDLPGDTPPHVAALLAAAHQATPVHSARRSGTIGAIALAGRPEPENALVLDQLAQALARAVENLRVLQVEHDLAARLQRALLPERLPDIPHVGLAARYVASTEQSQVGGDFYEAFERDEHVVVLAIGDVQGHSIESATIMAELRYALRAWALEGLGAGAIVDRLNRVLLRFHDDKIASVWVGLLDRRTATMEMANAGHIPPYVIAGGAGSYVSIPGALLGLPAPPRATLTIDFAPGSLMVLVTDGLLDRRDLPLGQGLERLATAIEHGHGDLDELCNRLIADIGPVGDAPDDIAVLVIRAVA
jgi:serine phosphatase RsbU (regulator of sigma subunit)/DNA-binding NarL/FixJ family response regulator